MSRRPYIAPRRDREWLIDGFGVEHPGHYMITLTKGGREVPAAITIEQTRRDPLTGEPMDRPAFKAYWLMGEPTDRETLEGKAGRRIDAAEYRYQLALLAHDTAYSPAIADPRKRIDLAAIQPSDLF